MFHSTKAAIPDHCFEPFLDHPIVAMIIYVYQSAMLNNQHIKHD
jgi:hypothetical protein